MQAEVVTIVSGLPRSGTSLMMQMLKAGGLPVLSDGQRAADTDNPRGYFEFEAVKKLKEDSSWLGGARGHVVKAISMLLYDLPLEHSYRVVFMLRDLDEVLASQREMMKRRGLAGAGPDDATMRRHFESHLLKIKTWLAERPHFQVLYCDYGELLRAPGETVRRLAGFLDAGLDQAAMLRSIDRSLYRNRTGSAAVTK